MFCGVFETASKPSKQRQPSQMADEIGARLNEPFSFTVLFKTTGVPRYKMEGVIETWVTWLSLLR